MPPRNGFKARPAPVPILKRRNSQSQRESDRPKQHYNNQNGGANSTNKRFRGNRRHVHWNESMPDMTSSGRRVPRNDVRTNVNVFQQGQHKQRPRQQQNVQNVFQQGQQKQWPRQQQDVQMTDVSQQPRNAKMNLFNQNTGQHQQDARLPIYSQSKEGQQAKHNARTGFNGHETTEDGINRNINDSTIKIRCKQLLAQIYADIHAASLPGAIQATANLTQLTAHECLPFSLQSWFQSNAALQTRSIFKVIEYAFAGQELHNSRQVAADIYAAANSVRLHPDHEQGRVASVAKAELRLISRHADLASKHGLMMLSILATSAAYREAARCLDDVTWDFFMMCIEANFCSLEYFAKIRGLDWVTALKRIPQLQKIKPDLKQRFPGLQADHPHTYVVPTHNEPLGRPTYKGQVQVPIQSNQYSARSFGRHERPQGWEPTKPYPSNPTVMTKAPCELCARYKCNCDPLDCDAVVKPLVEITNYGEKGRGIRVLQPIKKGDILEEYIGEIKHTLDLDDKMYSFSLNYGGNKTSACIDAQYIGNWTRFINHHCDASTKFELKVIGQRLRVMVVATKDIDMFDELTIDYGCFYWYEHNTICKCGSPHCVSKNLSAGPMDLCKDPTPDFKNVRRFSRNWFGQWPPRPFVNF